MEKLYDFIRLEVHEDRRGSLCVAEPFKNIPFDIRRIFYVLDAPDGTQRAGHAHKFCRQVLIGLQGNINVILRDNTGRIVLDYNTDGNPGVGLLVEPGTYIEYTMYDNAILLVLCSRPYEKMDYFSYLEEESVVTSTEFVEETVAVL